MLFRSRFDKFADPSAPPADLFNIWRDDYMLSPQAAAAEAADRARNTFFDGILPPFSNVGNTERDLGQFLDFFKGISGYQRLDTRIFRHRPDSPPSR